MTQSPARERAIETVRDLHTAGHADTFDLVASLQARVDTAATVEATLREEHRIALAQRDEATLAGRADMLRDCLAWLERRGFHANAAAMNEELGGAL